MSKNLVIVESPAKAKTIHKFLGKNYTVRACVGHIRDLPRKKIGIDLENNFTPTYRVIPEKREIIKELNEIAKKSDKVFLATDLDREGEAIAWHLAETLKLSKSKIARVIFNEITKTAITKAFKTPTNIDMDKVEAQQTRRLLDRIVGYLLSPLLWKKIAKKLSAGRVQSVAVKLVVEKEKEIRAFISEEFWKIIAIVCPQNTKNNFEAELKKYKSKTIKIENEEKVKNILKNLDKADFIIENIEQKEKKENPPPPFTTSLLQQQASTKLKFRTKHTMIVAQQLYEGLALGNEGPVGLITYMRTDSFRVSTEAMNETREYIKDTYGEEYIPARATIYKNKKGQDAHEAIRPTSVYRTPEIVKSYLSLDQYKLYKLIWKRFVASQSSPAKYAITTVIINANDYIFESKGKQILFLGYLKITEKKEEEKLLPRIEKKEKLNLIKLVPSQHFTQPPARYSEATLVKILESKGIGRPSTYSSIITKIQDKGYVTLKEGKFEASELGIRVTDQLENYFSEIMDVTFTSQLETKLDDITEKKAEGLKILKEFYSFFSKKLESAYKEMKNLKENPETSEYKCNKCGASMVYRFNKYGKFLGCSNFPECKSCMSLNAEGKPVVHEETKYKCNLCGKPMVLIDSRKGKFLGCSNYPACKNAIPLGIDGKPIFPEKTKEICDLCKSPMLKKMSTKGSFLACSNPECKNVKFDSKSDLSVLIQEKCEKCGNQLTIKKGPKGYFIACKGYPNCKNTKRFTSNMIKLPEKLKKLKCDLCQSDLVVRASSKGLFWGCSNYPKCSFLKPINLEELLEKIKQDK